MAPVRVGDVVLEATMGIGFSQYPDDPAIRRRPGLVVECRAVVAVPVQLDVPGAEFTAPRGPVDADNASRWQFCIQVVPRPPGAAVSASDPEVVAVPFTAPKREELLCTAATPLTLP